MAIMVASHRSNSRGWLHILTAASVVLVLFIILVYPSIPAQAKDYVVSYFPLQASASTAGSPVQGLHSTLKQDLEYPNALLNGGQSHTKPISKSEVPSTLLTVSTPIPFRTSKASTPTAPAADAVSTQTESSVYDTVKWFYQYDIEGYPLPDFPIPIDELRNYPPHNYKGHGQQVYATFFATRNGTLKDPYFLSALQIVYRLLWDKDIKGTKPVVIFIPPFVPDEQRAYFAAAGAMIREVDVREFTPNEKDVIPERLRDMFTKLEMWRHTDFDRIMYLDSDAIPFRSLESIWSLAKPKRCKANRLSKEDKAYSSTICEYVFAAWPEDAYKMLNAGVMVLKPTMPMYSRLVRESLKPHKQKDWDDSIMEQAFLDHMFNYASPFPSTNLSLEWNSSMNKRNPKMKPRVVHGKIWSLTFNGTAAPKEVKWIIDNYDRKWEESRKFYESEDFANMRTADLQAIVGGPLHKTPKVVVQSKAEKLGTKNPASQPAPEAAAWDR